MRISRVVDADGIARFADAEITVAGAPGDPAKRSEVLPVTGAMVMEFPEGFTQDWHPAPRRQIGIILEGAVEIETPDGQKQIRRRGDIALVEDMGTTGHRTRTVGGPARVLFLHLPAEVKLGD